MYTIWKWKLNTIIWEQFNLILLLRADAIVQSVYRSSLIGLFVTVQAIRLFVIVFQSVSSYLFNTCLPGCRLLFHSGHSPFQYILTMTTKMIFVIVLTLVRVPSPESKSTSQNTKSRIWVPLAFFVVPGYGMRKSVDLLKSYKLWELGKGWNSWRNTCS